MKISGLFKFYQNGELIGEAQNSLTQVGRILAIKTLMGAIPSFGTSIGVGVSSVGNQTAVDGLIPDTRLGFKVASSPVIGSNLDNNPNYDVILFKSKLTDSLSYRIYEVGLFSDPLLSGATGYKDELVLGFENEDNLYLVSNGTFLNDDSYTDNTNIFITGANHTTYGDKFRIGRRALVLNGSGAVGTSNGFVGLDQYDDLDKVTLSFYSAGGVTIAARFYTDNSYRQYTFTSSTSGYHVISSDLGAGTTSGSGFDWASISKVEVQRTSGSSYAVLDGLKLENVNLLDTNRGMVSRAVLPTPIVKLSNIPVDIEYTLRIGFNG